MRLMTGRGIKKAEWLCGKTERSISFSQACDQGATYDQEFTR